MDFFDTDCQESVINESLFGLCDDESGLKAYTNTDDQTKWIATVKNDNNKDLIFTAIDKCVIKDEEEPERGRCDGMLTFDDHIYFVELKDERKNWLTGAMNQLDSTVQFFIEYHDISIYKHKKVFVCNKRKRRKRFYESYNELNRHFFTKYRVRVGIGTDIFVV